MTEAEILKRIYPSVVTFVGDWRKMLKDVFRLKLREISLFLTCANFTERKEIYQALEKTSVKHIPHVHLRHDMKEEELDYLISKYKSKVFTVHYQYFLEYFKNSRYRKMMFIENNGYGADIKDLRVLKMVGGVCIDLAHLEHHRHKSMDKYKVAVQAAKKYKVGCNHISAVLPNGKSWHRVRNMSEFDYLKNIPKKYFSKYICIELVNPILRQLEFKKYVAKILAKSWNRKQRPELKLRASK